MDGEHGCGTPRTFGSLGNEHNKFLKLGGEQSKAKDCTNSVNPPLFDEDDSVLVSEKCIFPELHNIMGVVNHMFHGKVETIGE